MSGLLKCLQGIGRLKVTRSVLYEPLPLRIMNQSIFRNGMRDLHVHVVPSIRLWRAEVVGASVAVTGFNRGNSGTCSLFTSHKGQVNCFHASGISLPLQSAAGLQRVNTAPFHTSSHLDGRVTDFVQRHRQGLGEAPVPALTLGLAGLIPFVVPAVYTAATFIIGPNLLWAQVAYGASILSFLGGMRWGYALTEREGVGPTWPMLGYSVMPSLIAWLGLLMPLQASQLCVITGHLMAWAADMSARIYPAWFRSLRLILSLFAVLSLGVSYGFCLVYEPTSTEHGSNVIKLIKIVQIILED